ncbi:hypothetical protein DB346_00575 [Verrucomicrobia bacterium LW23]|nr:hypothetical protein DB346_00575 [Verrucomicrobia bacterium LW23]
MQRVALSLLLAVLCVYAHVGVAWSAPGEGELQPFGRGWKYSRSGLPKEASLVLFGGEWLPQAADGKPPQGNSVLPAGGIFRPAPKPELVIGEPGRGAVPAELYRVGKQAASPALALAGTTAAAADAERVVCQAFWAEPLTGPASAPRHGWLSKARLLELRGSVVVTIKGQKRRNAEDMEITDETVIRTGDGSCVILAREQGMSIRLMPMTEVTVGDATYRGSGRVPALSVQLKRGTVFAKAAPPRSVMKEHKGVEAYAARVLTKEGTFACAGGDMAVVCEDGRSFAYVLRGKAVIQGRDDSAGFGRELAAVAVGVPAMASIPALDHQVLTTVLLRAVAEAGMLNAKVNALLYKLGRGETLAPAEVEYLRRCPRLAVQLPVIAEGARAQAPVAEADLPAPELPPAWRQGTEALGGLQSRPAPAK